MVKDLKKSIGLLGGSFDPAHNGHLKLSKIALRKMRLNKVMWIVSKKNPFKNKPLYSLKQRIKKAREVALNEKKIQVSYFDEIVGSSRIINIVSYLINEKKMKNIYFIIGSDNLINFHKWKSWKKIVKLVKLVVFSRRGYDRKSKKSIVARYLKNKIIFIDNEPILISSTKLREKIQKIG